MYRLTRPARHAWLLALLPACVALAGCGSAPPPNGSPKAPPPAQVLVSVPVRKTVTDYEDFPGRIEARNFVEIRARVTGYLNRIHFIEGAEVKAGDLLFEIDPRPYEAELAQAAGAVLQMEGRVQRLELDYVRGTELRSKGAISREEFDKIIGERTEATGSLAAAKGMLDKAKLNLAFTKVHAPLSGRISRRFLDPGNMVKADETPLTTVVSLNPVYAYFDLDERSTLKAQRLLREGKVKWQPGSSLPVFLGLADAQGLCGTRVWLDPTKLTAHSLPLSAAVSALRTIPGVRVSGSLAGQPAWPGQEVELTLITPTALPDPKQPGGEPRLVTANLLGDLVLASGSGGQPTTLKDVARIDRSPKHPGFPRRGDITFADNRVDPDTGTWRLRATFDNPDYALYPGLYVRIRLPVGNPYSALLVSEQALGTDQGQKFLYVVNEANKAEYRRVQVGKIHDGLRVINEGVREGERVVVSGLQRVRPGAELRPTVVPMPVLANPGQPSKQSPKPGERK